MKFSIITPSFNQWIFIERTIDSVINQKWEFDIEYIVCDWWSNDNTVKILKNYEQKISSNIFKKNCKNLEFKRISQKDKWQSNAINKWLKMCNWDIISYINSDDTYTDDCFENVKNWFEQNPSKKRLFWKCKIINEKDEEIRKYIKYYKNFWLKNYSYSNLLAENFICQMGVFWKKQVFDEIWYFDENQFYCMDYDYWLRIWKKFEPLFVDKYLWNFRFYYTSKSWSWFIKQFKQELEIAKIHSWWMYKFSIFIHQLNVYKIIISYKFLNFFKI